MGDVERAHHILGQHRAQSVVQRDPKGRLAADGFEDARRRLARRERAGQSSMMRA
jgi:hypothetical protein